MLSCLGANAQIQGIKDFLGGCKYEIVVGYNTNVASEPYSVAKVGYSLGVAARKEVTTYMEDKIGIYGLTGLVLTKRGGKMDNDFFTLGHNDKNWGVSALSLPLHVGGEYKFNKCSLFADLGPNILFKTGGDEIENLSTNGITFGGGFNMGVRFKRFAVSFGFDQDFTNLGTFTPDYDQQRDFGLDKDKYNLKTGEFHLNLRWTLGKI